MAQFVVGAAVLFVGVAVGVFLGIGIGANKGESTEETS
jgi:hypothetical protein